MKILFLTRIALAPLCVVLSLTGCRKSNDASAQKESKITGDSSDAAISLKPTWPAGKRYVMRMESDQSTEMPNMQPPRAGQAQKTTTRIENKFAQEYALVATNAPDGNRGLEMEVLAIELESGAGNQMINYNLRNKAAPTGGAMGEALDQLIGAKIRYLLTPENKVLQAEGIDELIQRMEVPADENPRGGRGRGAATAMAKSIFNEEVLKQMIEFTGMPSNLTMRGSEPGHRAPVAMDASRGPGR